MQTQPQQKSSVLAWHFLKESAIMRDGKVAPADGVKLVFDDEPILCMQGLHASLQPFDALRYAPGPVLCLVRCDGTIVYGDDKLVCTERTLLARIDAAELLRKFARQQAMKVLHIWNAPDIVVRYLQTGDESLRAAVYAAVCTAADAAADAAAEAAAEAAVYAVYAAYAAADTAAYAAARAAENAAYAAAEAAAYAADAADVTVYEITYVAAYAAARAEFNNLVEEAFSKYLTNS